MVTTEHKLRVAENALSYWDAHPDRWVQGFSGTLRSGVCLAANVAFHSVTNDPLDHAPLSVAVMHDLEDEITFIMGGRMAIWDFNDIVCHCVYEARRPVERLRDRYRRELELEPEPVAVSEHEYSLVK